MRRRWSSTCGPHLAAVVAIGVAAACAPFRHGTASEQAFLYFTNESLDQADVYAVVPGSQAIRIGTVLPGRTDTLVISPDLVTRGTNLNIVARLLAQSIRPQSGPIPIHGGDRLDVRLPIDQRSIVVLPARP
jgi:hypothetical protein